MEENSVENSMSFSSESSNDKTEIKDTISVRIKK